MTERAASGERRRGAWRHLGLLLWKSMLLRRRHWLLTTCELLLPIGLFSVMLFIRLMPESTFVPVHFNESVPERFDNAWMLRQACHGSFSVGKCHSIHVASHLLFFGPETPFTRGVAEYIASVTGIPNIRAVDSNQALDEQVQLSYLSANTSAPYVYRLGLFFHDAGDDDPPAHLNYDLRMPGYWDTKDIYDYVLPNGPGRNYQYAYDGFASVQSLVDRYYISQLTGNQTYITDYQMETQPYPYPAYEDDMGISFIYSNLLPLFLVLAFVLLCPSLIKSVVHEKDTGVRELICLMGMNRWLVWLGWFLHASILTLVVVSVMAGLLKVGLTNSLGQYVPPILGKTDGSVVWLLLVLYGLSSVTFCMAVATLFNRPTLAMTMGILIWFLSYNVPANLMFPRYATMSLAPKLLSCLLPNMAVTWAFKIIQMFEARTLGVYWSNLWDVGNPRDQLTVGMCLVMLVVDIVLYAAITWYVDLVNPGTYGVPQPWYFPFMRSFWCGASVGDVSGGPKTSASHDYFEPEPADLKPGIVIRDLRKVFSSLGRKDTVAVDNVTLTCYEGQVTVLLGHNGAGKTTTMSMLTGVYAASGGYAEVNGCNIATQLSQAREELGLCPQHNMLFVDLTVKQHLLFFGKLKGLSGSAAAAEADEILEKLELQEKKDMFGSQLSGGMKRKLSLAIALIGGSKVVILDEPSSGLDPESRRWVWDVVQRERGRRTFLLTTHHMEEADVLGDRVAIMAAGRVVCAGSTLFLKAKFGDGYMLTVLLEEGGDVEGIKGEVGQHLPSAVLASVHTSELMFKLPPDTDKFAPLLDALTNRKQELGVRHVGLSLTSMEQVFLKVGEMMEEGDKSPQNGTVNAQNGDVTRSDVKRSDVVPDSPMSDDELDVEAAFTSTEQLHQKDDKLAGFALFVQRFKAFLVKRFIFAKRKWILIISQALLPVLVSLLALAVDGGIKVLISQEPPVTLALERIPFTASYVRADPDMEELSGAFQELFTGPYKVHNTTNMTASLLEDAADNLLLYRENNICSAEFVDDTDGPRLVTWFQTIPFHVLGIGMSLVDNALLHHATKNDTYTITTTNRPLPRDTSWQFNNDFSTSALVYSSVMPLALGLLSASFLVFPLQERETQAKQVQVMTGAPVWLLWLSTFTFDILAYFVSALLIFTLFVTINPGNLFGSSAAAGTLVLVLLLYGWGSLPFSYVFSFPFKSAASSFSIITLVNIVAGQMLSIVVYVLDLTEDPSAKTAGEVLHWLSSFIPSYPVAVGFRHLVETSVQNNVCDQFSADLIDELCAILFVSNPKDVYMQCCPQCGMNNTAPCFEPKSFLKMQDSGLGQDLLTLLADGVLFFLLIALVEAGATRVIRRWWWACRNKPLRTPIHPLQNTPRDDDVMAEEALVKNLMTQFGGCVDTPLVVSGLSKKFLGSPRPAVDQVSFTLRRGECLGLLGVNGAGKTTTFRMLTGDEVPSGGDAVIDGVSLKAQRNKFVQHIGYCPQFDAILGELTGVEMLTLMGRLRGVTEHKLRREVRRLVDLVDLAKYAARPSATYSGGNKRKLSTAMALVGSPPLVFLDEPSSGVDPASRRRVWRAVRGAVSRGQSVVLTSHSMEECEALCGRIVMMARGSLRCVGTCGHLKAKFGQGFSLLVKLQTHDLDAAEYEAKLAHLKAFIEEQFPGAKLTDQHRGMIAYQLPKGTSWGRVFGVMEDVKAGRGEVSIVEDYAASDTSLEQVFLSFAREANAANETAAQETATHNSATHETATHDTIATISAAVENGSGNNGGLSISSINT